MVCKQCLGSVEVAGKEEVESEVGGRWKGKGVGKVGKGVTVTIKLSDNVSYLTTTTLLP